MSGREHLNENVLLDAIYGIAGADADAHLRNCSECSARLSERKQMRAVSTGELSSEFLAAQRRAIYQRIEAKPSRVRVWAPVLAAACALTVGIFVYRPGAEPKPVASAEVNDSQLFADVFSMEQSLEPSATASVRVLFEEQQQ